MQPRTTQFYLKAASIAVIGFGLIVALAAHPATAGLTGFLTDLIFWPADSAQSLAAPETRLLAAISGGLMVGWGLLLYLIAARLYLRDGELARGLILASVGTWFAVDSLASIAAGAPVNAALNVVFLLAFVIPLWRPAASRSSKPA